MGNYDDQITRLQGENRLDQDTLDEYETEGRISMLFSGLAEDETHERTVGPAHDCSPQRHDRLLKAVEQQGAGVNRQFVWLRSLGTR